MILIDIGNTTIHFAVEKNSKLVKQFRVPTRTVNAAKIKKIIGSLPAEEIVICSVVPKITSLFRNLKTLKKIAVVGKDINVPIRSLYNKSQIGQDRLLGTFAAKKLFPEVRLVIDFGTAITFDFISGKGDYLGGFIFPGINLLFSSLTACALLPKLIKIYPGRKVKIPKNTPDSINKGIMEGIPLMINAWITEYQSWITKNGSLKQKNIIVTGGQAKPVLKKLNFPYTYEPDLILKGMIFLMRG